MKMDDYTRKLHVIRTITAADLHKAAEEEKAGSTYVSFTPCSLRA